MKVYAFNGSPRVDGNTYLSLNIVGEQLKQAGIEFEIIQVGSKPVPGCLGCGACIKAKNNKCQVYDDIVNEAIAKIQDADGILLGSPVHYSGVSGNLKSFLDRFFYVVGTNGNILRGKVGAAISVVRRTGGMPTQYELANYLNYSEMFIPTSSYWNVIHGADKGEINQDIEGISTLETLGQNMAYLIKVLNSTNIKLPERHKKQWMNFIR